MESSIAAGLVGLLDDLPCLDGRGLTDLLQTTERLTRTLSAVRAAVVAEADRRESFRDDGHVSARTWVVASTALPGGDATRLVRLAKVCTAHPVVWEHLAAGTLGIAQAAELGRVHANGRVRSAFAEVVGAFVVVAECEPYDSFVARVRQWERLADADGSHRDADLAHERRRAHLSTIGDVTYLDAAVGAANGAELAEILDRFTKAEFDAEWADLVARHGADAEPTLLDRTENQRRADALMAIFRRAAGADPSSADPTPVVNVVMTQQLFEEQLQSVIEARRPNWDTIESSRRWCTTTNGIELDPADVLSACMVGRIRRIVVGADGRVVDVGRAQRFFTAAARDAALIQSVLDRVGRCLWPGCGHRRTEIDHLQEWHRDDGPSDLANAGWLCPRHNRWKTRGHRVWRDRDGVWHTYRPDGSEITAA